MQILAGPHSDSSNEVGYDNLQIMDPDVFLQHGGNGDLDKGQENITPLMHPPHTSEHGYFGAFDPPEMRYNADSMLGGYLTVPPEADEQQSRNSDANSELDNYVSYSIDGYNEYYDYATDEHGNGLEDAGPQNHDYYNNDETRADASFIPLMLEREGGQEQRSHSDNQLGETHRVRPHNADISVPESQHYQSQNARVQAAQHDFQHAGNHQHQQMEHSQDLHADSQNGSRQGSRHGSRHGSRQEEYSRFRQESFQEQDDHQGQSDEGQEEYFEDLHTDSSHQQTPAFPPSRPGLERSVSVPSALGKSLDKKALAKKKKLPKGTMCTICDKYISRDFSRHIRIHSEVGRFQCVFPRSYCKHRSGKFNRPYDYKKHLLNMHFNFDDPSAKSAPNLTDKLHKPGLCMACGQKFFGNDWLDHHILTKNQSNRCPELYNFEQEQLLELAGS